MPTKWCDQDCGFQLSVCSQENMNCHFQFNISVFCRLYKLGEVWSGACPRVKQRSEVAIGASLQFLKTQRPDIGRNNATNRIYRAQLSFMSLLFKAIDVTGLLWVFLLFLFYYLFSYVWVCLLFFPICVLVWYVWPVGIKPRESVRSLGTGVTKPSVDAGNQTQVSKQPMVITTRPFLLSLPCSS